jgi:hypothetical protein
LIGFMWIVCNIIIRLEILGIKGTVMKIILTK